MNNLSLENLSEQAINLLKELIRIPSFHNHPKNTADHIESFLTDQKLSVKRSRDNLWCYNQFFEDHKPTILLASHYDTNKPNIHYKNDPFNAFIKDGKLFGLGSNDAGGSLVALIATFIYFNEHSNLPFNLILALSGEEENSHERGIRNVLKELGPVALAIVGEPTHMEMAIDEMRSMVLHCVSTGLSGHAARNEGINAINKAIKDIEWFSTYRFPIELGEPDPVKMVVTQINAGVQHNVIPAVCRFTVDIRFDNNYTQKEIVNIIGNHTFCEIALGPTISTSAAIDLLLVLKSGFKIGRKTYRSAASADQVWLEMPALKMGPGDPSRLHMPDEFIYVSEINDGIQIYIDLLTSISPRTLLPNGESAEMHANK